MQAASVDIGARGAAPERRAGRAIAAPTDSLRPAAARRSRQRLTAARGAARLSGRAVSRELQAHERTQDIPVIVVTGTDTSDLDPTMFACVMKKPIDPDDLVDAVQKCFVTCRT